MLIESIDPISITSRMDNSFLKRDFLSLIIRTKLQKKKEELVKYENKKFNFWYILFLWIKRKIVYLFKKLTSKEIKKISLDFFI